MIIEIYNPKAQLLVDWMARQQRTREVMLKRRLIPWTVRKQPSIAQALLRQYDALLRENARHYAKSAP